MKRTLIFFLIILVAGLAYYFSNRVSIDSIELTSPENLAMNESVKVVLNKDESIFIRYWKDSSSEKFNSPLTPKAKAHDIRLLLLEPGTK